MAKNKGKRRSKAPQNKQSSPAKNASSAVSRDTSPLRPDSDAPAAAVNQAPESLAGPELPPREPGTPGGIRKVSDRVAQFEQAALAESLLNHERGTDALPLSRPTPPKALGSPLIVDRAKKHPQSRDAFSDNDSPVRSTFAEQDVPEDHKDGNLANGDGGVIADHINGLAVAQDSVPQDDPVPDNAPTVGTTDGLDEDVDEEDLSPIPSKPQIPQRSIARSVEPETIQTFEATRQPVMIGRPVMLESVDDSRDLIESDVDLDSYFDSPDDVVVTAATVRKVESPEMTQSPRFDDHEFDMDAARDDVPLSPTPDANAQGSDRVPETRRLSGETGGGADGERLDSLHFDKLHAQANAREEAIGEPSLHGAHTSTGSTADKSPQSIRVVPLKLDSTVSTMQQHQETQTGMPELDVPSSEPSSEPTQHHQLSEEFLPPPPSFSNASSPTASPRAYKYQQSPLPKLDGPKPEPPIIGVCVVGFHHQRGPEVEYWIGPDESQSTMWPYLPFQSLPDGSHQFEENVTYFMLLYDRDRHAATSLTFDRDEDGHIKQGTTDFRNVTTLFAVACSKQIPASDLQLSEDEEYTRSTVQKSVVVIASKPLFGPIKEKLTVVTRSYFAQRNFGDRSIIDHFYHNLVQMPLWTNENDLNVGMNLQKCIHDFGVQALYIFKAMLLETKILFYASDTDVLGTTQFALVSLVPNLINHLEDSGSPLLSSFEMNLQRPTYVRSSDRQSLLRYMGLPLQLFAGGGVFSPFVPLQQFDDLKQPETQYGMMGTTNKLFLGTDIDFDVVVNVDSNEVTARNPEIGALLQLTDQDKAFINTVKKAVDTAWDTHDNWQPQSLVYYGGEDYIRHEFEEYLMALLASAKYEQFANSDPAKSSHPLQHYGAAWSERWMRTNNFRIANRNTDRMLFELVEPVHPGVRLQKPSGFERFFGIFKSNSARNSEGPASSSASVASQASSTPRTPSLASGEKVGDQLAPASPSTPRRWFWQSEPRDRNEGVKGEPDKGETAKGEPAKSESAKNEPAKSTQQSGLGISTEKPNAA